MAAVPSHFQDSSGFVERTREDKTETFTVTNVITTIMSCLRIRAFGDRPKFLLIWVGNGNDPLGQLGPRGQDF